MGLEQEADQELWPVHPVAVAKMEAWCRRARDLAGRRERHARFLDRLRRRSLPRTEEQREQDRRNHPRSTTLAELRLVRISLVERLKATSEGPIASKSEVERIRKNLHNLDLQIAAIEREIAGTRYWRFRDPEDQALHDERAVLVAALDRFCDPGKGTLAMVEARLQKANSLARISLVEAGPLWRQAIASIADRTQCPAYDGMGIVPQLGLIPVGRDPASGLWEFAHVLTGKPAQRDAGGRLVMREETGVVLVLLPGGAARVGAMRPSREHRLGTPNVDRWARAIDGPVQEVELPAFFVSKFEFTQAQWVRLTGENPSYYSGRRKTPDGSYEVHTLLHPVDRVSVAQAMRELGRTGLTLPTEVEWEYAQRGGTGSPWVTGWSPKSLEGAANLADRTWAERSKQSGQPGLAPFDDGWEGTAPVGSYAPNAFGLHDVHGNVHEFCRDAWFADRLPDIHKHGWAIRGGSCQSTPIAARSAWRTVCPIIEGSSYDIGFRPSRPLETSNPAEE